MSFSAKRSSAPPAPVEEATPTVDRQKERLRMLGRSALLNTQATGSLGKQNSGRRQLLPAAL